MRCSTCTAGCTTSQPSASCETDSSYPVDLKLESKHPLANARQLLDQLVNEPVKIEVSADGKAMGNATLDLAPAATHGGSCVARTLQLEPVVSADGGTVSLSPDCTVSVSVTFSQDAEEATIADGATAALEFEAVSDAQGGAAVRVPFEFVTSDEAEETSIVTATATMTGEPGSLAAGATLAGGFTTQLALCWACAGVTCGVPVTTAEWSGNHLEWPSARAVVLHREHFLALRAALANGLPIFAEIARCVAAERCVCRRAVQGLVPKVEFTRAEKHAV